MKILVTGPNGKLAQEFVRNGAIPLSADVTRGNSVYDAIKQKISGGEPFVVLHMAAKSDVEFCEKNLKTAQEVNIFGTSNVLEATRTLGGRTILFSTCHVFNGNKYFPYSEKHTPDPVNYYGFTKLGAEAMCTQYRDSVIFRIGKAYTERDIEEILKRTLSVPKFIVRNYISVAELVEKVFRLVLVPVEKFPMYRDWYRVLHLGTEMNWSMYKFYNHIRNINGVSELPPRDYPLSGPAPRPFRVALDIGEMKRLLKK